jgi:hypothetical protein
LTTRKNISNISFLNILTTLDESANSREREREREREGGGKRELTLG